MSQLRTVTVQLQVQTDLDTSHLESTSNYPHPGLRKGVFHVLSARVLGEGTITPAVNTEDNE